MTSRMLAYLRTKLGMNSSRVYLDRFVARAAASVPPGSLVLDAGCGDAPYRHYFQHVQYESADLGKIDKQYGRLTYICDLAALPVRDGRYDLVLLSQVLEHVPDPLAVLRDIQRALRVGGRLWLSVPFFYEEHEVPYDFFRYTQFGLRELAQRAGLMVHELTWLEGYPGTLAYQLDIASRALSANPRRWGGGATGVACAAGVLVLRPCFLLLSLALSRLDARHRETGEGHCKNWILVAEKPGAARPRPGD